MNLLFFILLQLFSYPEAPAAAHESIEPPLEILNDYAEFTNECIHGLLIVHRLLENFNQELNKKITGGQKLNFYSNADLPKDIFEDPKHWFFVKTPYQLFLKLKQYEDTSGNETSAELFALADRLLKYVEPPIKFVLTSKLI